MAQDDARFEQVRRAAQGGRAAAAERCERARERGAVAAERAEALRDDTLWPATPAVKRARATCSGSTACSACMRSFPLAGWIPAGE